MLLIGKARELLSDSKTEPYNRVFMLVDCMFHESKKKKRQFVYRDADR